MTTQIDDLLDPGTIDLFVWNWRTGKLWLVSRSIILPVRTNLMEMLKKYIQTRNVTAHFIDEYRLFGTVCHDHKIMLMLWDSSNPCNPEDLPGTIFERGPNYVYSNVDWNTRSHETNHVLPFREISSMGITAFVAYTQHPITKTMTRRLLTIPVKTLASSAHRIGEVVYVSWQDWGHFATPIELPATSLRIHILHSQVLSVREVANAPGSTSMILVWDFSLHSRRRQVQNNPSARFPPYAVPEFTFGANYHHSAFDFTEGGVLITSVRTYVIVLRPKVLT